VTIDVTRIQLLK